jgi:hypothetical protein
VSSQWDGLRHFAYQKEELFYNGVTLGDIHGEGFVKTAEWQSRLDGVSTVLGIQGMRNLWFEWSGKKSREIAS